MSLPGKKACRPQRAWEFVIVVRRQGLADNGNAQNSRRFVKRFSEVNLSFKNK
jgi:hypothetical protein